MSFGYFGILLLIGIFGTVDSANVNQNQSILFSDSCDYRDRNNRLCGDICFNRKNEECYCGGNPLVSKSHYCCSSPTGNCTRTQTGASCSEGESKNRYGSHLCNSKCYNDYLTSEFLGPFTFYTCPENCIFLYNMCQGVSFCDGDLNVCDKNIRCPEGQNFPAKTFHMATNPVRSFCIRDWTSIANNGKYETIGRVDENITSSDLAINYTYLEANITQYT